MSGPGLDTPYWSQDAAVLSAALGSGPGGLSSKKAAAKLRLVGPNNVEDASHTGNCQRDSVCRCRAKESFQVLHSAAQETVFIKARSLLDYGLICVEGD